jgi:hypothetical protein
MHLSSNMALSISLIGTPLRPQPYQISTTFPLPRINVGFSVSLTKILALSRRFLAIPTAASTILTDIAHLDL